MDCHACASGKWRLIMVRTIGLPKNQDQVLVDELRGLIDAARANVAQAVNSALTLLYWQVGRRIRSEVLKDARAEYGQQIVATVSRQLVPAYGQGFGEQNLRRMMQFSRMKRFSYR